MRARASEATEALAARATQVAADATEALKRQTTGELATRALSDFAAATQEAPELPVHDPQAVRRSLTGQAQLQVCYQCHFCGSASSSFDLACAHCNATVCARCIATHLVNDTHCPRCRDKEFCSESALRMLAGAAQVRESAESLWQGLVSIGHELFNDAAQPQGVRPSLPGTEDCLLGVVRKQYGSTVSLQGDGVGGVRKSPSKKAILL